MKIGNESFFADGVVRDFVIAATLFGLIFTLMEYVLIYVQDTHIIHVWYIQPHLP